MWMPLSFGVFAAVCWSSHRVFKADPKNSGVFWGLLAIVAVPAMLKPVPFLVGLRHGPGLERLP